MKLSVRETTLGCITGAVLIVAGTWIWAEPRLATIAETRRQKRDHKQIIDRAEKLIAREEAWKERLNSLQEKLPQYGQDEKVTAEIMQMLEERAKKAGLSLLKASPEKEKKVGELYQMAFNYRWEGDLTSLVRFLYDLQSENLNLDIRQLSTTPTAGKSQDLQLKGNFTVDVAYTRVADPHASESE